MTLTRAPSAAEAWLEAARPRTLTAAIGAVAVGSALAHADGRLRLGVLVAALIVAVALQLAANLYNDYGDYLRGADTERIGPLRATSAGWLAPAQVRRAALAMVALAALAGLPLVWLIGWPALAVGAAAMLAAILYTAGPRPLAYVGLGDVFVLVFFGVVAVCGTYRAHGGALSLGVVTYSLAVGAMATAILVVNNLRDRDGDRRAAKHTLVVRFGARFGRAEYLGLVVAAYLLVVACASWHGRMALLAPLATLPFAARQIARVMTRDGVALNLELARTAQLGFAFNLLLALGVLR